MSAIYIHDTHTCGQSQRQLQQQRGRLRRATERTANTTPCTLSASKKENVGEGLGQKWGEVWAVLAGGCLGPEGHGLGWRPRVEAGEGRGGSRARTAPRQKPACADTPSLQSSGVRTGRTCAHSPSQPLSHRLDLLVGQPPRVGRGG